MLFIGSSGLIYLIAETLYLFYQLFPVSSTPAANFTLVYARKKIGRYFRRIIIETHKLEERLWRIADKFSHVKNVLLVAPDLLFLPLHSLGIFPTRFNSNNLGDELWLAEFESITLAKDMEPSDWWGLDQTFLLMNRAYCQREGM